MGESDIKLFIHTLDCIKVIRQTLLRNKIYEYGPGTIEKLLCFIQKYLLRVLDEAKMYMENDDRTTITLSDIKLVIDLMNYDQQENILSNSDVAQHSKKMNERPLPEIKLTYGLALPSQGDYCLNKPNYKIKSARENQNVNIVDTTKHPLFSPMNIRFPNLNFHLKSRMKYPQQAAYTLPMSTPLFRFNSSMPNSFPVMPMHKQKLSHIMPQPQKITVKPKINIRSNVENANVEQKKEFIKRPVCTEPQKIVFKPKLLLSLNTNIDNLANNAKNNLGLEESSPSKRKKT